MDEYDASPWVNTFNGFHQKVLVFVQKTNSELQKLHADADRTAEFIKRHGRETEENIRKLTETSLQELNRVVDSKASDIKHNIQTLGTILERLNVYAKINRDDLFEMQQQFQAIETSKSLQTEDLSLYISCIPFHIQIFKKEQKTCGLKLSSSFETFFCDQKCYEHQEMISRCHEWPIYRDHRIHSKESKFECIHINDLSHCTTRSIEQGSWSSKSSLSRWSTLTSCSDNAMYHSDMNIFTPSMLNIAKFDPKVCNIYTTDKTLPKEINSKEPLSISRDINVYDLKITASFVSKFEANAHRSICVIPDIVLLPNMKIVLLDHYHNCIQLFDDDYTPLCEHLCPYPMGVCLIGKDIIAVTLRRNGQLQLFKVTNNCIKKLKVIKITCDAYLWQVSFKANRLFVVCDENNIHIMDINGVEETVLYSGVPTECGYLRYFDVSDNGDQLFLSEKKGLRCIGRDGKLSWKFTTKNLSNQERDNNGHVVEDVLYHQGFLFATQWTLSKILLITAKGQFIGSIVTENIEHPRAMSILNNTLMVTQFNQLMDKQKNRTVKVFNISCKPV